MKELPSSNHLFIDPAREALFEVVCSDIEVSKGQMSIIFKLANLSQSLRMKDYSLKDRFF